MVPCLELPPDGGETTRSGTVNELDPPGIVSIKAGVDNGIDVGSPARSVFELAVVDAAVTEPSGLTTTGSTPFDTSLGRPIPKYRGQT
jgi:hypothetical protein